jgi:hypothetical protein
VNEGGNVLAFRRWDEAGNPVVVIANFSNTDYPSYRVGIPLAGAWSELVNSQSSAYDGNGLDNPGGIVADAIPADGFTQSLDLVVPRMGLIVLAPSSLVDVADRARAAGSRLAFTRVGPVPARAGARFEFAVPRAADVRLELFDVTGRRVAVLADGPFASGLHAVRWDGRGADGAAAPAGLYFARLAAGGETVVRNVAVVR